MSRSSFTFLGCSFPVGRHAVRSRPETGSLLETRAVCHNIASHHERLMHSAISDFIQRTSRAKLITTVH